MGLYWSLRRVKGQVMNVLGTQIDLTAEVNLNAPIEQAIRTATTKYFCSECNTQISFRRYKHFDAICKRCQASNNSKSLLGQQDKDKTIR